MIKPDLGEYQAHALLRGEKLDYARHELIVDVKAVTLHQFSLIKLPAEWQARVVLDI